MDGKCVAPTSKKLENITELGTAPWDQTMMKQGSKHQDRIFIKNKKERLRVAKLSQRVLGPKEFLNTQTKSSSFTRVKTLVKFVVDHHGPNIPGLLRV